MDWNVLLMWTLTVAWGMAFDRWLRHQYDLYAAPNWAHLLARGPIWVVSIYALVQVFLTVGSV